MTKPLRFIQSWSENGNAWLEGKAVVGPDGKIVDILRVILKNGDRAAIVHVDKYNAHFNPSEDFIDFPGGNVKFSIRYDSHTKKYWSLTNKQRNPPAIRNILTLISSHDLRNWKVNRVVLSDMDQEKVGFQYADFQFDGNDIISVVRTAFGDATNNHDSNYLIFKRIEDYELIVK
jgi:hypothetical protein